MIKRRGLHYVYMVRCKYGTFYTGYTKDVRKRLSLHNAGHGAKYLRGKGPVKLVYLEEFKSYKSAVKKERAIKALPREKKQDIVDRYAKRIIRGGRIKVKK